MFKFYHKNYIINNKCMESSNKYHKICPNRDIWINYHILLGEGGFGKVYKGKDATKNILVAIKVLPRS